MDKGNKSKSKGIQSSGATAEHHKRQNAKEPRKVNMAKGQNPNTGKEFLVIDTSTSTYKVVSTYQTRRGAEIAYNTSENVLIIEKWQLIKHLYFWKTSDRRIQSLLKYVPKNWVRISKAIQFMSKEQKTQYLQNLQVENFNS